MARVVEVAEALRQRMANQGLSARTAADVAAATRQPAGIQAQDLWASRLAVRARARHVDLADVIAATQAPPLVVRSWLMRGTLHMVAAEDLRWLLGLFGPRVQAMARRRQAEVGLTPALLERAAGALPDILRGTALTRAGLVEALRADGVDVPAAGQAPSHLTVWASAHGIVCRGPEQRSAPTYVLLDEWIMPDARPSGGPAMIELVRRYLRAFGPATVEDMVAWSRLTVGPIRAALAALGPQVHTWSVDGRDHVLLEPVETVPGVLRLLPAFDSYVMGYRRRELFLDPARHADILDGGMIHPMIVLDGAIIGTWRLDRAAQPAVVTAQFFTGPRPIPVDGEHRSLMDLLHEEADDIGRFLGRTCVVRVLDRIGDRISPRRPRPSPAARV